MGLEDRNLDDVVVHDSPLTGETHFRTIPFVYNPARRSVKPTRRSTRSTAAWRVGAFFSDHENFNGSAFRAGQRDDSCASYNAGRRHTSRAS